MTLASVSGGGCARLDALTVEELPGGLRLAHAKRFAERARGLARLDALPPGYALQIPRCRSVHTFTMRFPSRTATLVVSPLRSARWAQIA